MTFRKQQRSFVPRLAVLEDRCVPSLVPSADGMTVYDTSTKMTWLADANLAATDHFHVQGINPDGSMTWSTAMNWVAAMNKAHYLGHSDWILPRTPATDPHATLHNQTTHDDFGFDFYSCDMGELFYKEFGAEDGQTITAIHNAATRLFNHFQPYQYWSGTMRALPADFSFGNGFLGTDVDIDFEYAIPEFPSVPVLPPAPPPNDVVSLHKVQAHSSLTPIDNGRIVHDATLNINWLANADLAASKRFGIPVGRDTDSKGITINPDGSMKYESAVAWIAALNKARYLGHDNWRLPDASDSSPKQGYYQTNTEMGELYYTELGGQAGSTILLRHDSGEKLFRNFQPYYYWSGSNVGTKVHSHETFSFGSGYRSDNTDHNEMYVLPVFDGPQVVTNTRDHGAGSLRAVIAAAHAGDTIVFAPSLIGHTIALRSTIDINVPLDIEGPGVGKLTIRGTRGTPLFHIAPGASKTTITGLTLR